MTLFGLPDLLHQVEDEDMGDLEFIQEKVLAGDYFQVSGDINALNDTIEFVVPDTRTAFLLEAKIVPITHSNPPVVPAGSTTTIVNNRVQAQLLIDSNVKDTANVGTVMSSGKNLASAAGGAGTGTGNQNSDKFNVKGLSLVGDAAKKIEIKNTLSNGSAFATMSGYLA